MPSSVNTGSGNNKPGQLGFDSSNKPHAYDAVRQREYFEGVVGRRIIAFLIDIAIILLLTIAVCLLLIIVGIFTFGLTWLLLGMTLPAVALAYNAYTLSRPQSATIG
ncbi:MAG: RDD family protein, partial [Gammaproteobacteria bacterium]